MLEIKESSGWSTVLELLQLFWRKKYIIAAITAITLVGGYFNYLLSPPNYRASSIVMIGGSGAGQRLYGEQGGQPLPAVNVERLETDLAILQSFPLAERVVDSIYAAHDRDLLEIFGERKYKNIFDAYLNKLFGTSKNTNQQERQVDEEKIVAQNVVQDSLLNFNANRGEENKEYSEQEKGVLSQETFSRNKRHYAELLQSRISVNNQPGTNIINVSIGSPFPDESALLVNVLCNIFQGWNLEQAESLYNFINNQLTEQAQKVRELESALSSYMTDEGIYELSGNAEQILSQVVAIDTRYNDLQSETNILKRRMEFLTDKLSGEEKKLSDRVASSLALKLNAFKEKIRNEEKALQALILEKGKEDLEAREKQAEIVEMRTRLNRMIRTQIAGELGLVARNRQLKYDLISEQLQSDLKLAELEYSANELLRLKSFYEAELDKLPNKQLELARLQRDREVMNNTYLFLRQRLEESRMDIASKTGEVVIVGRAFPPDKPVSPSLKKKLLNGFLSGFGLSLLLVYVMNMFDNTIRDEQFFEDNDFTILARIPYIGKSMLKGFSGFDVHKSLAKIPIIGQFFQGSGFSSKEKNMVAEESTSQMLITDELSSVFAESFRDLRTNLGLFHDNSMLKSLLVTGTSVSEGKSTVCANLGLSMALLGKKVIVVDCDLRRPSQHFFFSVAKNPGVSDFLSSDTAELDDINIQTTSYENLFILPAGTQVLNPNELLYSSRMQILIDELKRQYDLVLLDTPPILLLSDAALLSQSVNGVLLTARIGQSTKNHFKELKKLVFLKENLLGVVLTGNTFQKKYGKYGYSYKHLDHYVSEEK